MKKKQNENEIEYLFELSMLWLGDGNNFLKNKTTKSLYLFVLTFFNISWLSYI